MSQTHWGRMTCKSSKYFYKTLMKYHYSLLNINITSRNIIVMYGLEEKQYSNTTSLTSQFLRLWWNMCLRTTLRWNPFMARQHLAYGMSLCCLLSRHRGSPATDDFSHLFYILGEWDSLEVCARKVTFFSIRSTAYNVCNLNFTKHEVSWRNY